MIIFMNQKTIYRLLYFRDNDFIRKYTISLFIRIILNFYIFFIKNSILTIMRNKNLKKCQIYIFDNFNK
jgi:hypothetical protein